MKRPEYLSQGEEARLFPVLSTTSKEGRTASIVLACFSRVDEFAAALLNSIGKKTGKRSEVTTFTEVVFKNQKENVRDRPDGLIVVKTGNSEWRALVEAKIGGEVLKADQIEKYRAIAKDEKIDCVITISNQFATTPTHHPLEEVVKSRSKIPVFHWSWTSMLTTADLLIKNNDIADGDQEVLLYELCRFLTHDSAGVKGFDRMPKEWTELNKLASAGGKIPAKSEDAEIVVRSWFQETRDLSLILSRKTETVVTEKMTKAHRKSGPDRLKDAVLELRNSNCLSVTMDIPYAAAPLTVVADLGRRTLETGMTLRAPEDKVSSKARLNWLLRQLKSEKKDDVFVRMNWPGRSEETVHALSELTDDPALCEGGKDGLQVLSFHLFVAKRLGVKFTQQTNFISELEHLVPWFYQEYGQNLAGWRKPAPRIETGSLADTTIDLEELEERIDED